VSSFDGGGSTAARRYHHPADAWQQLGESGPPQHTSRLSIALAMGWWGACKNGPTQQDLWLQALWRLQAALRFHRAAAAGCWEACGP
jgi:hypothetical protein